LLVYGIRERLIAKNKDQRHYADRADIPQLGRDVRVRPI
jgi:hypothetical protein